MNEANMEEKRQHTFNEIFSQPDAWADAVAVITAAAPQLQEAWAALRPHTALFVGCGSTHYLSQSAAAVFQRLTGIPSRGVPGSELLLFPELATTDPAHTLLVAISRSGTTTETLQAVKRFRGLGGPAVWAITCYPESDLATTADLTLVAASAQEQSVAQTRSFSSMLLLAEGLAAVIGGEDLAPLAKLPAAGAALISAATPQMEALGRRADLEKFFFLGSGLQYGVANEGMLKMKEMSLSHSEAFHFLEFRHGPVSMVGADSLVAGLLSPSALASERQVLQEMVQLGAAVLEITPGPPLDGAVHSVRLSPGLPAWVRPVLYLPPLQLLAYYRTLARQLNPDNPRHLEAVVTLDPAQFAGQAAAPTT
jgi:glucosamine--fructose-6-phosphate aminotransferase (isomerizing)